MVTAGQGPTEASEPSSPETCTCNANFLKTARTAQEELPKGSYSAILDSIPFSISSRKGEGGMAGSRPPPSPEEPAPHQAPQPLQPQQDQHVRAAPCFYPHVSGVGASRFLAEVPKAQPAPCVLQGMQFPSTGPWQTQQGRGSPQPFPGLCPWPAGQHSLMGLPLG